MPLSGQTTMVLTADLSLASLCSPIRISALRYEQLHSVLVL